MVAIVSTVAYLGLEARAVEVQAQLIAGLPAFHVVGLADKAVAESRERVRGAVAARGPPSPPNPLLSNLTPAALPTEAPPLAVPAPSPLLVAGGSTTRGRVGKAGDAQ